MTKVCSRVALLCAMALISGCAAPKHEFGKQTNGAVKNIAIVEYSNPASYQVMGAASIPEATPLLLFGALGGAVLGGMEEKKAAEQGKQLSDAMSPYKPDAMSGLREQLTAALTARGFQVSTIKPPTQRGPDRELDYSASLTDQDAVLEPYVTFAGYRMNDGHLLPMVRVRVRLISHDKQAVLYYKTFLYGDPVLSQYVNIPADAKYTFSSLDRLYGGGELAAGGIKDGIAKIANRIAADLD